MLNSSVRTIAVAAGATILALVSACTNPTAPSATPSNGIREGVVWGGPNNPSTPGGPPWGAPIVPNNEWQ
jgi:hypothetical protein